MKPHVTKNLMCNKVNAHPINIQISLITCVYLFTFIMLHGILDLELVKVPKYCWLYSILEARDQKLPKEEIGF